MINFEHNIHFYQISKTFKNNLDQNNILNWDKNNWLSTITERKYYQECYHWFWYLNNKNQIHNISFLIKELKMMILISLLLIIFYCYYINV